MREKATVRAGRVWLRAHEFLSVIKPASMGTGVGFLMGLLPGMAGTVPPYISYNLAKATSRNSRQFGNGAPEGIAAPEATNAAVMHATLVPAFALGIPGTPTSAIILGAMTIGGLTPGPELLSRHPATVYTVFLGLFVGTGLLWLLGIVTTNLWARLISIPPPALGVAIIVLCTVGVYAGRGVAVRCWAPLSLWRRRRSLCATSDTQCRSALGAILGPIVETNLRQALVLSSNNPLTFVEHPLSLYRSSRLHDPDRRPGFASAVLEGRTASRGRRGPQLSNRRGRRLIDKRPTTATLTLLAWRIPA